MVLNFSAITDVIIPLIVIPALCNTCRLKHKEACIEKNENAHDTTIEETQEDVDQEAPDTNGHLDESMETEVNLAQLKDTLSSALKVWFLVH